MRTWRRSRAVECCGKCDKPIAADAPFLEIQITGVRQKRPRCQACAGEAPPVDVAPPPEPVHIKPFTPIRLVADSLPLDFKTRRVLEGDK